MGTMDKETTDDWMNPPKRENSWGSLQSRYPRFLIERKRRLDYFPFEEWGLWATFEKRDERNAALKELYDKHPAWQLRERDELYAPQAYL